MAYWCTSSLGLLSRFVAGILKGPTPRDEGWGTRKTCSSRRRIPGTRGLALVAGILFVLGAAVPAKADYAVLRGGQRLHITGWQNLGDTVRLDLPGGSVTISADELAAIEPEEVFGASAQRDAEVPYSAQIQNAARTYGLDPALISSVIAVESNFNSRAVSKKSALGLMQLLPETAAQLAVPNAFDPVQNINGGTRYLRQLLDRYDQNLVLALAAYNAGPKRVDFYHGIPPIAETRSYINRVITRLQSQPNLMKEFFSNAASLTSPRLGAPK
jgi:transglycosylase-like protein with SLT domain